MLDVSVTGYYGYSLNLANNEELFKLVSIEGLNPTKTNIYSSDVFTVDGSTFNYAKDDTRNIVFNLILVNAEKAKNEILKTFTNRKKIKMLFKNRYQIEGYVENIEYNFFENKIACQISVICLYPYFKDTNVSKYILTNIVNLLEFPFNAPPSGIPFGDITTNNFVDIINESNLDTGMIIEVNFLNSVNNITITNLTNRSFINVNKNFSAGDILTINTYDVIKKIELNGNSVINYVTIGESFIYLSAGNNRLTFKASTGDQNAVIEITNIPIYTGI